MHSMTSTLTRPATAPRAGTIDDGKGYERDETDQFHQLVQQLVADGDDRAQAAGRRARRTLAEMAPGYDRQPILYLTRPLPMRAADDACPLCGYWTCRCGSALVALTDEERKDLSDKVKEVNKRSESRPK
ncbi:hypothetical protein OG497_39460 [Streptomyces sp. NBC_01242]|uniref:hypothetical protein n=1 Tax=Streptomyces sp. NBC_01242 TaxID=2903795 RepID=UPI0022549460|nr:hypothetical protein [Streptomyces sp. NBC_01242]MCX4799922.1 hypothetical protein [Streptomyces sp. NBC_01242]